jgi:xanthine dehydrogenase accessory factor
MLHVYQCLTDLLKQHPIVLATVVRVTGSTPREVSAIMVICPDGNIVGTIGGGAGEAKVIQQALRVLETGAKQMVVIDLSGAPHRETQGVCGGSMEVWLERWQGEPYLSLAQAIGATLESGKPTVLVTPLDANHPPHLQPSDSNASAFSLLPSAFLSPIHPAPTLLIVGAGHCAIPLARVAALSGFRVVVQDDRPAFANPQRFPDAALVIASPLEEVVQELEEIPDLYAALVTRGYLQDTPALKLLLQRSTQYIGMIGSEKRVRTVFQSLKQEDHSLYGACLQRVYAPIGLDIGALTPEEIAVSICAELIKVRRGGTGRSLSEAFRHSFERQT